jgi:hypothetical protein
MNKQGRKKTQREGKRGNSELVTLAVSVAVADLAACSWMSDFADEHGLRLPYASVHSC